MAGEWYDGLLDKFEGAAGIVLEAEAKQYVSDHQVRPDVIPRPGADATKKERATEPEKTPAWLVPAALGGTVLAVVAVVLVAART